jgi:hypothetical protein
LEGSFQGEIIILSRKDEQNGYRGIRKISEGEAFRSKMEERGCPG